MGLSEVKRFMACVKENRRELEKYNETMIESGAYLYNAPLDLGDNSTSIPVLPENREDDILEEIIHTEEAERREKTPSKDKEGVGEQVSELWDNFVGKIFYNGESKEKRNEAKKDKLFLRLAKDAKANGFDVTADDLEYFVGAAVSDLLTKYPEEGSIQIFERLLDSFVEDAAEGRD